MPTIEARLSALGVDLPEMAAPAANYVPFSLSGKLLFTAGQLPFASGKLLHTGLLGVDLTVQQGQLAARQCAINILSVAKAAKGLQKVVKLVKLTIFVASAPGFTEQHLVGNGASDLLTQVMGSPHARSAVGVASLPLNAPVEIEAMFETA